MTFEQKIKAYELSEYIFSSVIPCYSEGFLLSTKTFSILDDSVFMIEYENLAGCFHLPVNQIEISSWINENSEIILSGKYFLKGWKNKNCYFLTPVLIKQRCEIQLIPIPYNFLEVA